MKTLSLYDDLKAFFDSELADVTEVLLHRRVREDFYRFSVRENREGNLRAAEAGESMSGTPPRFTVQRVHHSLNKEGYGLTHYADNHDCTFCWVSMGRGDAWRVWSAGSPEEITCQKCLKKYRKRVK